MVSSDSTFGTPSNSSMSPSGDGTVSGDAMPARAWSRIRFLSVTVAPVSRSVWTSTPSRVTPAPHHPNRVTRRPADPSEREVDPGQLGRALPQPTGEVRVERPVGALDLGRPAPHLQEPVGTDEGVAGHVHRGGVQRGQGALLDRHAGELVAPAPDPGLERVAGAAGDRRRRRARVGTDGAHARPRGAEPPVELEEEEQVLELRGG